MSDTHGSPGVVDMNEIRQRVLALQKSASNLAQLDLEGLASLLPPDTPKDRLIEIKHKLIQLHNLQNRQTDISPEDERHNNLGAEGTISRSSRYKTELCRPYEENGVCKYGQRCQFAHGVAELRTLARHPKYKSQLCRTFHSNGLCPYGHRCHFIHNQDEVRTPVPTPFNAQQNPRFNDFNNNTFGNHGVNGRRNDAYSEAPPNQWGGRASFSQFPSESPQNPSRNPYLQSYLPKFGLGSVVANHAAGLPAMSHSVNPFQPLSTGRSLGSAGELSPPVSPIVYSPDDAFITQAASRSTYFPLGIPGDFTNHDLNLDQMLALAGHPATSIASNPVAGSGVQPGAMIESSQLKSSTTPMMDSPEIPPMPFW